MEGLKQCPFCGGEASLNWAGKAGCDQAEPDGEICKMFWHLSVDEWNSRVASGEDHERVNIPTHENEAALMVLLGTDWLEKNAPHRLRERESGGPDTNEQVKKLCKLGTPINVLIGASRSVRGMDKTHGVRKEWVDGILRHADEASAAWDGIVAMFEDEQGKSS